MTICPSLYSVSCVLTNCTRQYTRDHDARKCRAVKCRRGTLLTRFLVRSHISSQYARGRSRSAMRSADHLPRKRETRVSRRGDGGKEAYHIMLPTGHQGVGRAKRAHQPQVAKAKGKDNINKQLHVERTYRQPPRRAWSRRHVLESRRSRPKQQLTYRQYG